MPDDSTALRRARRQDSTDKRRRAAETIATFEQGGEPVTLPAASPRPVNGNAKPDNGAPGDYPPDP